VLRACAMALVGMSATLVGRPVSTVRVLSIAVVVLLLADPFLVHSVGFALSVGASAGIACLAGPLTRRLRGPRWVREPLAVTLAAQAGVAPVLVPVFGGMPAITPVANLLAVPAAEPLTVYGLVASWAVALAAPLQPIATLVHVPTTLLLRWVTAGAQLCARVPLTIGGRSVLALVALACAAEALRRAGATLRRDARRPVPDAAAR
jgi:competence protein ComEC